MSNFKGEASERTWLTSILKRKVIDHYRKSKLQKRQKPKYVWPLMNYTSESDAGGDWLEERVCRPFRQDC
jgi:DNA-directed RNA polymerase specialized sigma24 family protein